MISLTVMCIKKLRNIISNIKLNTFNNVLH